MKRRVVYGLLVFAASCLPARIWAVDAIAGQQPDSAIVERVIDGDTFVTSDGERVRIAGIDAQEGDAVATKHLTGLIGGKSVRLEYEDDQRDLFGRLVAMVHLSDGVDIGAKMIQDGCALAYLKYPCSRSEQYLALEKEAREAGRGMWYAHRRSTKVTVPQEAKAADQTKEQAEVFVTRTGKKYHRSGCRHLSKSMLSMSLREASSRYEACSVCAPPAPSGTSAPSVTKRKVSSSSGRCAATTKKGTRCKRKAKAGSSYCWQHGG